MFLTFWDRSTFESICHNFGGLESISSKTLNMLDCNEACIEVKKNLWFSSRFNRNQGLKNRENMFIRFGVVTTLDPPNIIIRMTIEM